MVQLSQRLGDGTKAQHLQKARKQAASLGMSTSAIDAELEIPSLPPGADRLLHLFNSINSSRGQGFNGPLPISFLEIKAFCELTGEVLTPWEVETIKLLDAAYLDEVDKLGEQTSKQEK